MRYRMPSLLFAAMSAAGCAAGGHAVTRDFPVGGFDRISNNTPFDVRVRTGAAPAARANGPQEAIDRLDVSVRDGELVVASKRGSWFAASHLRGPRMVIDVSVPMLRGATLSGPGDLSIDRVRAPRFAAVLNGPGDLGIGTVEVRDLAVTLNGPGDVSLAGRVDTATLLLHGPGDIKAAGLTARDATVNLSGPGDVTATVTGMAHGTLSGPGDITIHGGARCDITRHGPGDVHCG